MYFREFTIQKYEKSSVVAKVIIKKIQSAFNTATDFLLRTANNNFQKEK